MQSRIQRRRLCAAFTLIELMIVVAIIAMLAAIAVPQYQNYVARTQFAEALTLFSGVRTAVDSEVHLRGPDGLDAGRIEELVGADGGDYVDAIDVSAGGDTVDVSMQFADEGVNTELAGESVTFTGQEDDEGAWGWDCDPGGLAEIATGLCAE
ncbi:pilin [Halorhodospira sp. 9622]|uniref:pilin n=1 Tax=Halorhodospira sp. 9622 TaxID=2899136 RepID=UPI00272DCBA7|nr:pilin [Halorhodospira sp. 9622]